MLVPKDKGYLQNCEKTNILSLKNISLRNVLFKIYSSYLLMYLSIDRYRYKYKMCVGEGEIYRDLTKGNSKA